MKATQLANALKEFGLLARDEEAVALTKFAQTFEGLGDEQAAAVVTQIAKNWTAEGRSAKRPAELAEAIRKIERALSATGAKTQAAVFAKLAPLLAGHVHQDVDSFVRDALAARLKKSPPPKPPKPAKVVKPKFSDLAPELAEKLKAVASDRSRFDALLVEYADRYKTTELKAIANFYLGFDVGKKNKDDILKAMRNWQREEELHRASHAAQAKVGL